MAPITLPALLSAALLLASSAQAQSQSLPQEVPFSYVQPLDTTILNAYGHSPPVYPSRTWPFHCSSLR
jgi:hypothetical protein